MAAVRDFGAYILLVVHFHLIVEQKTVEVTEVKYSYWVEPEEMRRSVDKLADNNIEVSRLATDHHPTIQKVILEEYANIKHEYDLWPIVKSIKKNISKTIDPELMPWKQAMSNH